MSTLWYGTDWGKLSPWCPQGQSHVVVDVDQWQSSLGCLSDVMVLLSLESSPWLLNQLLLSDAATDYWCFGSCACGSWFSFVGLSFASAALVVVLYWCCFAGLGFLFLFSTRVMGASSGVCAMYGALTGWSDWLTGRG